MTSAAIYLRISKDREGKELGVERQEQQCRALAKRLDLEVIAIYTDNDIGASRHSLKARPRYQQMLTDALARQFEVIMAATSSRLTRRPRELEDLLDLFDEVGTLFEYVKSPRYDLKTADGRKHARYAAADDAAESDRISERVIDTLAQRRESRLPHGGQRRYGWELDRRTHREDEAQWIRTGVELALSGIPFRNVVRALNHLGSTNAHGGDWRHVTLRNVLLNPAHAGLMRDGRTAYAEGSGADVGIISPQQHRALVRMLNDPKRVTTPGRGGKLHLLSGIAVCGVCGGPMRVGKSSGSGSGPAYLAYRCSKQFCVTRRQDHTDAFVRDVMAARLRRPDAMRLLAPAETDSQRDARAAAEDLAERLRQQLDSAAEDGAREGLSLREVAAYSAPLRVALAEAERAATAPPDVANVLGTVLGSKDPGAAFLALDTAGQRTVIEMLMTINIGRGPRGNVWRPDGIEIDWPPRT